MRKNEIQKYEIEYSPHTYDKTVTRKVVDTALLENQVKLAMKFKMIDKKTSKQWLKKIKLINNTDGTNKENERKELKEFIDMLKKTNEKYKIQNEDDVKEWFIFTDTKKRIEDTLKYKDRYFRKINAIRAEKLADWYVARVSSILLADAETLLEGMK